MTDTLTRPAASPGDVPGDGDRSMPLLVAAAILVLLIVGAVLLFGVERPPALESLADVPDPAPSASVAWTAWSGEEMCVSVARPSGEVAQLLCDRNGGELVGWPEPRALELHTWDDDVTRTIDVGTGEVLDRSSGSVEWERIGESTVRTQHRGGRLTVRLEPDDTVLWRTEAPERYDVHGSARSADGDWVAMVDGAGRLLVVAADGSAPPRVWAREVDVWEAPVWEGTSRS
jgi:hypothetical protein